MSLPYVYNGISSPSGTSLGFIGDSAEHDNRRGSTVGQYLALAGEPVQPLSAVNKLTPGLFILEDYSRRCDDTVIGGAAMVLATKDDSGEQELHITSCFVREELRHHHLGSYIIGKMYGDYTLGCSPTKLYIHPPTNLSPDLKDTLLQKGFLPDSSYVASLSLLLPGWRPMSSNAPAEVLASIKADRKNALFQGHVYRKGVSVGNVRREASDSEDSWEDDRLVVKTANGKELASWDEDNPDIDWMLTGAIYLLNHPSVRTTLAE